MLAVIDCKAPRELDVELNKCGYIPLRLPPHPCLPAPVASHPDMLLFFAPCGVFSTKSYAEIANKELEQISGHLGKPIFMIEKDFENCYPKDVLFNAVTVGKRLLCLPMATASEVTRLFANNVLPVRQGYTKCSTLPVGDNALITSDISIASAASRAGIDVLQISPGYIALAGYDYGFIGGCTSFSPYQKTDTIYFCGDISVHPDAAQIHAFCNAHNVEVRTLGAFSPTDIGTIFLI